jgi:transposase
MYRTTLTDEQRAALQAARHDARLKPHERDRVEMLLLSAAGWSPPQIAQHFGCTPKPVRALVDRYRAVGLDAIHRKRPGPPPDTARKVAVAHELTALLAEERTWTTPQLAAALTARGIALGRRQTRRYLHECGAGWRRTVRTLDHKQDPQRVARAQQTLAALKKGRQRDASRSPTWMNAALPPASR